MADYRRYNDQGLGVFSEGLGSGFTKGLDRAMQMRIEEQMRQREEERLLKKQLAEEERKSRLKREEDATMMSDRAILDERKLADKRRYDEERYEVELADKKALSKIKSEEAKSAFEEAQKIDKTIQQIIDTAYASGAATTDENGNPMPLPPQTQGLIDKLQAQRNELLGYQYTPPLPEQVQDKPSALGRIAGKVGGAMKGIATNAAQRMAEGAMQKSGQQMQPIPQQPAQRIPSPPVNRPMQNIPTAPAQENRIRVRLLTTGQPGTILEAEFDPNLYERIQ